MKPFFIKMIYKNLCLALTTEIFFKVILIKKCEYIVLKYIYSFSVSSTPYVAFKNRLIAFVLKINSFLKDNLFNLLPLKSD